MPTYTNKGKALYFIEALQPHAETTITSEELLSAANMVENFENPKLSKDKSSDIDIMFRDGDSEEHKEAVARDMYERRVA